MERVELPIHNHPLIPFTRFEFDICAGCFYAGFIYGGYRCNELGCQAVFHKECAESLPEINHSSHPEHPLKLIVLNLDPSTCRFRPHNFNVSYCCLICDFKLDLSCLRRPAPLLILEKSNAHEHPLELCEDNMEREAACKACHNDLLFRNYYYRCHQCESVFHVECVEFFPEPYKTSHPEHPLKLPWEVPQYADKKCLLCAEKFFLGHHHCDICNVSICRKCMKYPPPFIVVSSTTHKHQLHLVPRRIDFTCNACGTQGDRSPYFCLQCNFMIHRDCIDMPRVININRHDHRISYTPHLGHGEWKCGVCRKKMAGFYGGYSCSKCSNYVVHSRCATRGDVWDKLELEGTPEEEIIAPFEVIDDSTIKHFGHDHYLRINKNGMVQHESTLCEACVFQICSESFYSCDQCGFIIHEKCANLPLKKRHLCHNQPLTLDTGSHHKSFNCFLCRRYSTGYRYANSDLTLDVRCGSVLEPLMHKSHPHPLYFDSRPTSKTCSGCKGRGMLHCDECDFSLDFQCALLPQKVMRHRYDDHPLSLSYGGSCVDGQYWCEACEKKLKPNKWFYTCNDCCVTLHVSCVVRDFSFMMPGINYKVASNTSICRPLCSFCKSRCTLPSARQISKAGVVAYFCSLTCWIS